VTDDDRRFVEHFAKLFAGDRWAAADLLAEHFPPEEYPQDKSNSGLHKELERFSADLARHTGTDAKVVALRQYRSTALAWPHDVRTSCATFDVHLRLLGRDDREEVIAKVVRYAQRNGAEIAAKRHFDAYRAQNQTSLKPGKPLAERLDSAIRRAAKKTLLPATVVDRSDWWTASVMTDTERATLADVLERFAREVRGAA
jgi:hypothetical protein